jgi:hypothetical protein
VSSNDSSETVCRPSTEYSFSSEDVARVFLPKCFTLVFVDFDLDLINDGLIKNNLF